MNISLVNDLKIKDVGVEKNVSIALDKISVDEKDVIINFCDCGVDYPATSKILDKILLDLARIDGHKTLVIVFDFDISEYVLQKWFFLGSVFFGIAEDRKSLKIEEFTIIINEKLRQSDIVLTISIKSAKAENEKSYVYGR